MRCALWLSLLVTAAALPSSPGRAQGDDAVLTAPQAFALAERYRRDGRTQAAEALLEALTRDRDPVIRAEARFRLGQSRMRRHDYRGAVDAFSALLAEKPDVQPARIALAQALALEGKPLAAAAQFRRAQSGGLPPDVQQLVDRFGDVLRRTRPYGLSLELGIAPDSNINQATQARTIDIAGFPLAIDDSGRASSGIGLTASADAFATLPLRSSLSLVSRVAASGNFYRQSRFDDLLISASTGPEWTIGRTVVRPAATYSWRQFGGSRYSQGFGGMLQMLSPAGKTGQIGATVTLSDQRYRIAAQSGLQLAATVSYEKALSPRLYARLAANVQRADAKADAYATTSFGGSVSLSRDVGAATVYMDAGYLRTNADGPFALFGAGRRDDRIDLSAGAAWKRLSLLGLTPVIRLQQTFNRSPLAIYQFKRTRLELALREQF
jgi:tetratricopeptide (TPR) repeat protein